jgi:hypothetical protein
VPGPKRSRRGSIALLALVLVALMVFFGVRAYTAWQILQAPPAVGAADTGSIRPRMSVRFIARSHLVPLADLAARLGAPADGNITLLDLASRQGLAVLQVEDRARQAIADLQASSPGPGPPVQGPGG